MDNGVKIMENGFKVVGFFDTEVITPMTHKDLNSLFRNMLIIGENYESVEAAIDAGEKAWRDNDQKLNYRVETMFGEQIMVRYADIEYTICSDDYEEFVAISVKMDSFHYIYKRFNE